MAEATTTTATPPPAAAGSIDLKALGEIVGTAVANAVKPLQERIDKFETAAAAAGDPKNVPGAAPKDALTADQVKRLMADELKADRQAQAQQQQQAAARSAFVTDKMKDLPAVYQASLGNDPAQWAAQEQKIREQYRADFKLAGGTTPNVTGAPPAAGSPPAAAVNLDNMSPTALISQGLKATPTTAPATTTAAPAAAAASA